MKIVLDTSTLVSGIFYSGKPSHILDRIFAGEITLVITDKIYEEYVAVCTDDRMTDHSNAKKSDVLKLLQYLVHLSENVTPTKEYEAVKQDLSDNKFIDAAYEAGVQYIVSSDKKHLLKLKKFKEIPIVSPADFLNDFGKRHQFDDSVFVTVVEKPSEMYGRLFVLERKGKPLTEEDMRKRVDEYKKEMADILKKVKRKTK